MLLTPTDISQHTGSTV